MTLTLDYLDDGNVTRWTLTTDGVDHEVHEEYRPTLFIRDAPGNLYGHTGGSDPKPPTRTGLSEPLASPRAFLDGQAAVADLGVDSHRQTFRTSPCAPLRAYWLRLSGARVRFGSISPRRETSR